jgi:hypothetical protein
VSSGDPTPRGGAAPGLLGWLDPAERLDEVLFGLIMTLTFTLGSGLTAEDGPEGVRQLLVAALGCNLAWGIIDGTMCVTSRLSQRNRRQHLLRRIHGEADGAALGVIRDELEETLEPLADGAAREHLYAAMLAKLRRADPAPSGLRRTDLYAGVASFALVFGATFPAVVPFFLFSDKFLALRASNAVLLGLLFAVGWRWAGWIGLPRLAVAGTTTALGLVLVAAAIALGG